MLVIAVLFTATFLVAVWGVMRVNDRALRATVPPTSEVVSPAPPRAGSDVDIPPVREIPGARELRKCVAPDGALAFQDRPCPAGHETVWTREFVPDRRAPPPRVTPRRERGATTWIVPGDGRSDREAAAARCADMRAAEAAWRRQRGNEVTFTELRAWGDRVYDACRNTR